LIISTPAIILKTILYGDTSIISKCFTLKRGKIDVIVKGARSPKSNKSVFFQPFSYTEIIFNEKNNRDLQLLSKVNYIKSWNRLQTSLKSMSYAFAIVEMTDKALEKNDTNANLFNTLVFVLDGLDNERIEKNILFWYYEVSLLSELGFEPDFKTTDFHELNKKLVDESIHFIKILLNGDINSFPSLIFPKEISKIISNYLQSQLVYHIEGFHKLKSLKIIREILAE
tara:strand:+ start:370 stop:1050 length:681 start_codon:yes stop_codon:yes gene_type:complete